LSLIPPPSPQVDSAITVGELYEKAAGGEIVFA